MIPFPTVCPCCRIWQGSCGLRSPCKDVAAPAERQAPRQEAEVPWSSSVPISVPWGKAEKGFMLYCMLSLLGHAAAPVCMDSIASVQSMAVERSWLVCLKPGAIPVSFRN